ncbi:MAG TPA: hypothetical protein VE621_20650 [Bryobacteraceae bacterium]|nr:hypothetical protein [Bryobacteraceae bacterium]
MPNFRSLLSPFFDAKPTPPEPFGFKTGWIAVRTSDLKAVTESLPIRSHTAANWPDGLAAAYKGGAIFITPPVNGWICVLGDWPMGIGRRRSISSVSVPSGITRQSVEAVSKIVADLSSRFGEAHGYAKHRVVEYHHWILAKQGRVVRCFAYLGETGEILCQSGSVTEVEKSLRYASLTSDEWVPDEQDVMVVASGWSFDPTTLSAASSPAATGIIARLK